MQKTDPAGSVPTGRADPFSLAAMGVNKKEGTEWKG
jgi:hypothetical protein